MSKSNPTEKDAHIYHWLVKSRTIPEGGDILVNFRLWSTLGQTLTVYLDDVVHHQHVCTSKNTDVCLAIPTTGKVGDTQTMFIYTTGKNGETTMSFKRHFTIINKVIADSHELIQIGRNIESANRILATIAHVGVLESVGGGLSTRARKCFAFNTIEYSYEVFAAKNKDEKSKTLTLKQFSRKSGECTAKIKVPLAGAAIVAHGITAQVSKPECYQILKDLCDNNASKAFLRVTEDPRYGSIAKDALAAMYNVAWMVPTAAEFRVEAIQQHFNL